jgi:hypothetical protein
MILLQQLYASVPPTTKETTMEHFRNRRLVGEVEIEKVHTCTTHTLANSVRIILMCYVSEGTVKQRWCACRHLSAETFRNIHMAPTSNQT